MLEAGGILHSQSLASIFHRMPCFAPKFFIWPTCIAPGVTVNLVRDRGFDHGVFVPLLLMYPEADMPILQVSLSPPS